MILALGMHLDVAPLCSIILHIVFHEERTPGYLLSVNFGEFSN